MITKISIRFNTLDDLELVVDGVLVSISSEKPPAPSTHNSLNRFQEIKKASINNFNCKIGRVWRVNNKSIPSGTYEVSSDQRF